MRIYLRPTLLAPSEPHPAIPGLTSNLLLVKQSITKHVKAKCDAQRVCQSKAQNTKQHKATRAGGSSDWDPTAWWYEAKQLTNKAYESLGTETRWPSSG